MALTSLVGARAPPPGNPWQGERDVAQAFAEAAFEGAAHLPFGRVGRAASQAHPGVRIAYGVYSVIEFSRKVTAERVDEATVDVESDLHAIDRDAALVRTFVAEGRPPSRDPAGCARDPEPCAAANRLWNRMQTLPGGSGRFVLRALNSDRTLLIATRNFAEDNVLGWLGGGIARLLGIRRVTPVLQVSTRGVRSPFVRAEWTTIRHIARRFDLLTERMAQVLASEVLNSFYDRWLHDQIEQGAPSDGIDDRGPGLPHPISRIQVIAAPQVYAPIAARAVAIAPIAARAVAPAAAVAVAVPIIRFQRSSDPVIDRATVQNQFARQYAVEASDEPATHSEWQEVEDRSTRMPDIHLPSGPVDFDGVLPH